MNADSDNTEELMCFIASEMRRDDARCVADNARILSSFCSQAALLCRKGERPVLIIWMQESLSYQGITGKRCLAAIAEIAGEYTDHILGEKLPPRVIVGRVNCYQRKPRK